jgi:hypothetical protein
VKTRNRVGTGGDINEMAYSGRKNSWHHKAFKAREMGRIPTFFCLGEIPKPCAL